jgi:hypothetical protein
MKILACCVIAKGDSVIIPGDSLTITEHNTLSYTVVNIKRIYSFVMRYIGCPAGKNPSVAIPGPGPVDQYSC